MSSLSTNDFAWAIEPNYSCTETEVRGWCEEGLLRAFRNPVGGSTKKKWRIPPSSVEPFLKEHLKFNESEVVSTFRRLAERFGGAFQLGFIAA